MSTKTGGTIDEAIAQGERELTPREARIKEITDRLANPLAPQIKYFKREVRGGIDLFFEIKWKGETFSRAITFKSRKDLQSASAMNVAIIKGLFAEEFAADEKYVMDTRDELAKLLKEVPSESK